MIFILNFLLLLYTVATHMLFPVHMSSFTAAVHIASPGYMATLPFYFARLSIKYIIGGPKRDVYTAKEVLDQWLPHLL